MINVLRKSVTATAVAACIGAMSGSAMAVMQTVDQRSFEFGVLNASDAVTVTEFGGDYLHTFSFIQSLAHVGVAGAVVGFDIYGDMTAQFRTGVGATPSWSAWTPPSPTLIPSDSETGVFAFSQSYTGLTGGETYWFQLQGSASSATYTVTLSPAPEPENWALMLSGLALMGVVARRRKFPV